MRIVIDIPEVFIAHWEMDRFKDSLLRMKADADSCEMWSGNYEAELCEMLITAFEEAHEIPVPHGRLIDADELQRQFERMANEEWNKNIAVSAASCFDDAAVIVEDAPTIIAAEE